MDEFYTDLDRCWVVGQSDYRMAVQGSPPQLMFPIFERDNRRVNVLLVGIFFDERTANEVANMHNKQLANV